METFWDFYISCFSFFLLDLPFLVHPSIILWVIWKIKINYPWYLYTKPTKSYSPFHTKPTKSYSPFHTKPTKSYSPFHTIILFSVFFSTIFFFEKLSSNTYAYSDWLELKKEKNDKKIKLFSISSLNVTLSK